MSAAIVALVLTLLLATSALGIRAWLAARARARKELETRLERKGETRLEKKRERAMLRSSASSEIYVDAECCTSCGIPTSVAPDLFEERDRACAVRRQPRTVPELRRALKVFMTQDLGCVRYRGTDRRVVALLTKVGCRTHCDEPDDQRVLPIAAASSTAVRPASSSST